MVNRGESREKPAQAIESAPWETFSGAALRCVRGGLATWAMKLPVKDFRIESVEGLERLDGSASLWTLVCGERRTLLIQFIIRRFIVRKRHPRLCRLRAVTFRPCLVR